jgi:hypothetical protein
VTTPFSHETEFAASGKTAVLAAYFNEEHLAVQDKAAGLCDRTIVEAFEDDAVRKCTWSVRSTRVLPIYVRPFVEGGRLTYRESMTWRKAADEIDESIVPQVLGGRVVIESLYQLSDRAPGKVCRRFAGTVTVNLSLLSGKIERAIVAEIEKGIPLMTECTRSWLQRAAV